jgi:hypothetical protein
MGAVRVLAFVAGAVVVVSVLLSAMRTVVVPRAQPVRLARATFLAVRRVFEIRARPTHSYEDRDRVMALYAPAALLILPGVWAASVMGGFTVLLWGLGIDSWRFAFVLSADSLTTLGTFAAPDMVTTVATTVEAVLGLGLVALLISYLPSIYGAFQRRELAVAMLEVRAGDPPSPVELIQRQHRIGRMEELEDLWEQWLRWFADLEETHTSQASLPFFRSPTPTRSWVTAAGCVLDAASLVTSVVDLPRSPRAQLCIRSGYLALRRISDFFQIPYDPQPAPDDPISIDRSEFEAACDRLAAAGVPLLPDRDAAWRAFNGWRVNYDPVLLGLAGLVMAPWAMWSSDRSLATRRPPVSHRRRRRLAARP